MVERRPANQRVWGNCFHIQVYWISFREAINIFQIFKKIDYNSEEYVSLIIELYKNYVSVSCVGNGFCFI